MHGSRVCVIGTGHLGSIVSACLSDAGFVVAGVDKDSKKIEKLKKAIPPVYEPGLRELLLRNIKSQRLSFTTKLSSALKGANYVFITYDIRGNSNDETRVSDIFEVSREMAKHIENGSVVIISSQVPVGTCEQIKSTIKSVNPSLDLDVASVPEKLRLGQGIECFLHPTGIVIGAENPSTLNAVEQLFSFVKAPKIRVDTKTAEMSKHVLNAFLATSISFINEIANLCDKVGVDALKIASILHIDERIGEKAPLRPGLGFSGGTLLRDLNFLKGLGKEHDCPTHLINAVIRVNEEQSNLILKKLRTIYGSVRGLTVGVLGLTYKPGTSTIQHSVALEIIKDLKMEGAIVKVHDPRASLEEVKLHHQDFDFCLNPYMVAEGSHALILVTAWPQFRDLDFTLVKSLMKNPVIIDAQNALDAEELESKGLFYFGVGRGRSLKIGLQS